MAKAFPGKDIAAQLVTNFHKTVLRLSGGRIGNSGFGMPVVILHTTGAKTGKQRETVLTSPVHDDDKVVLIASYGGDDRHPAWYRNLTANPDVELTMEGATRTMRARTATGPERDELWPQVTAAYRGYQGYQESTDREIPVVVLEPR